MMSRIRSIKPEFWTSEQVLECSTNARLLFIGLWNFCDDCGRHPWSAKQAKAEVFPADDISEKKISEWLQELSTNGLIVGYVCDDKHYFYVSGWKHQRIDKPQSPKYPDPFSDNSTTIPGTFPPDTTVSDPIRSDKNTPRTFHELADFEKFWSSYPRKVAKKAAQKAFEKAMKETNLSVVLNALAIDSAGWKDEKYIPHPATWLNGGRYLDHGTTAEPKTYRPPNAHQSESVVRVAAAVPKLLDEGAGLPDQELGGMDRGQSFKPGIRRMG